MGNTVQIFISWVEDNFLHLLLFLRLLLLRKSLARHAGVAKNHLVPLVLLLRYMRLKIPRSSRAGLKFAIIVPRSSYLPWDDARCTTLTIYHLLPTISSIWCV